MNIYAGNLSSDLTEDDLRESFEAFGQVESVNIIKDKYSGESRGFGFIIMPSKEEAQAAIEALNGKELNGNAINVNEARPKRNNRSRGGSRGGSSRGPRRGGQSRGNFGRDGSSRGGFGRGRR